MGEEKLTNQSSESTLVEATRKSVDEQILLFFRTVGRPRQVQHTSARKTLVMANKQEINGQRARGTLQQAFCSQRALFQAGHACQELSTF